MSKEKKKLLELIEEYRKVHKKDWFSFARGIIIGLSSSFPKYEEASLSDFKEWLLEEQTK